jgi:hypothetical protein
MSDFALKALAYAMVLFLPGSAIGLGASFLYDGFGCCGGSHPIPFFKPVMIAFLLPGYLLDKWGFSISSFHGTFVGLAIFVITQFSYFFLLSLIYILIWSSPPGFSEHTVQKVSREYCPNCGWEFSPPSLSYCRQCGQLRFK